MRGQLARAWICLAVLCGSVQAADKLPWEEGPFAATPEATLQAAARLTPPDKAAVDILLEDRKFEFDKSRRVRKTERRVYRLLTKEALNEWSVVTAGWSPWHEERPQIQVRVISTDGMAHELDAGTISEAPVEQSGQVFRDQRRLVAPLPGMEVGAVVEWQIVVAEHRPFCDVGGLEEHFFHASIPVRSMRLVVEAPEEGPPLHQRVRGIDLAPKRSVENGVVRLEFGPLPLAIAPRLEGFLPAEMPLVPHVVIGNGSTWAEVAQHYARLVDRQIGDASYAEMARGIVGEEKSRDVIVQKLLEAVQKRVRYVGIEFGESGIVPHSPQETLKLRYGDCKDQSTLLVALLRSLGYEAHVVLLRAGRHEDLLPEVPALNAFDHAIVHVPGDAPLWIDPTAPLLRAGELPAGDKGRLALIASAATTDLVRTPEAQSADNTVICTRELVLATEDRGQLRETHEFHGTYESQVRSYYAESKPEDLRHDLERNVKQDYGIEHVAKFDYGNPRDLSTSFRISYEADGVNHGVGRPVCNVLLAPEMILEDVPFPLQQYGRRGKAGAKAGAAAEDRWERKAPLQFPRPYAKELRFRLVLPAGFLAAKLPDSFAKQFGPASISASFAAEANNLVAATFRFDSGSGRLSPDQARDLHAFLGQLHSGANGAWLATIQLEHTASQHIAQGRIREGLAEFQRLVAQYPSEMDVRMGYVESLVDAGIGAAARQEGRRATELDAKSSWAWQALGYARMYDDFGRFMGPGSDPLAAEAALRKAVEIDPKFHVARWNLAMTLEYGSGPRHYAPGPRLQEAGEQYRRLREENCQMAELPTHSLLNLAYTDRWPEVASLAAELHPSPARNALWVAALAVTADAAAAKAKAVELGDSDEARRGMLLTASDALNNARQYAGSAEMVEQALPLIPDSEARKRLQGLIAGLKSLRRMDESLLPKDDPRRLVQQLHMAAFAGSAADSALPLFVEEATRADASIALDVIRMTHAGTIRTALKTGKSRERLADTTAVLTFTSSGDAAGGYRVAVADMRWYVVRRKGELRLLPSGFAFSELGREALRHLEQGDEAGARRWLEWAAVEQPPPAGFFPDPFSASPFGFLWNGLKRNQLKIAAAVLAASAGNSDEALRTVTEFRQTSTSGWQLLQIDRVLARALAAREEWEQLLEVAERVQASHKTAEEPVQWKLLALNRLYRLDELQDLEEQRLAKLSGNARAWSEGFAAAKRGDLELARKLLRPLVDSSSEQAEPIVYNELAWDALFQDQGPTEAALADAVAANARSDYQSADYLHTLATVHAELEHPVEARKFLLQAIEARDGKPAHVDYYVLGRIAECYGFQEVAAEHYAQVIADGTANSTYNLAQRRLKRMRGQ